MASLVVEVFGEGELFMKELIHINIKIVLSLKILPSLKKYIGYIKPIVL